MESGGMLEDVSEVATLRDSDFGTGDRIDGGGKVAATFGSLDGPGGDEGGVGLLHDFIAKNGGAVGSIGLDRGDIEGGDRICESRDDPLLRPQARGKER
jgi:hypothetical protein